MRLTSEPGVYVLLLFVDCEREVRTRARCFSLKPGYYVYVGSAGQGLAARLRRYVSKRKKKFWHIDFLLEFASLQDILLKTGFSLGECEVAGKLATVLVPVDGFGSSDCGCVAHLFRLPDSASLSAILALLQRLGFSSLDTVT